VEKNTAFAKELKVDYPILSDPTGEAAGAYGIFNAGRKFSSRTTFIIGEDGKILEIISKVSVGSHGADLAKKLEALGVAKAE
jgi:peroxiredoxin Q/BCP